MLRPSGNFWRKVNQATDDDLQELQVNIPKEISGASNSDIVAESQDSFYGFVDDTLSWPERVNIDDDVDDVEFRDCTVSEDAFPLPMNANFAGIVTEDSPLSTPPPVSFESNIATWAVNENVTHKALSGLLKILKKKMVTQMCMLMRAQCLVQCVVRHLCCQWVKVILYILDCKLVL